MASIPLPKVLTQRKNNSPEAERENFERAQGISLAKAINSQETPVKEKHVRSAIIGTFHEKGSRTFWNVVLRLQLQGNPIVCWKFCHVLHKVLREGHPRVLEDSQRQKKFLKELERYWSLLKEGYGKLIGCYCSLLVAKLEFHSRNPRFPGSLSVSDEQLEAIGERDVNVYFQLCCEMFDYMDEILSLQSAVFGSLDMSRSNSMTNSGQCRLAPLIPCIQDSSYLYDFSVKLLFKLHASLPADTLVGHRDRFLKEFSMLQQFYLSSNNLQYFKYLIQIPLLPDHPPNFLISSDFSSHISPVVILRSSPAQSEDSESLVDLNLVDVSPATSSENQFDDAFSAGDTARETDGAFFEQLTLKDRVIDKLMKEIDDLRMEIQKIKIESRRQIEELERLIKGLEKNLDEKDQTIDRLIRENELLQMEATKISETEETAKFAEKAKAQEEKFMKMKEIYSKLRDEHVGLIRSKAEVDKQLSTTKGNVQDLMREQQQLETQLSTLQSSTRLETDKLQQSHKDSEKILTEALGVKENLESQNRELSDTVTDLRKKCELMEADVLQMMQENKVLNSELDKERESLGNEQQKWKDKMLAERFEILVKVIEKAECTVNDAIAASEDPSSSMITCTPEYLLQQSQPLRHALQSVKDSYENFSLDPMDIEGLMKSVNPFAHHVAFVVLHGKASSQTTANIEHGDELAGACKVLGTLALSSLESVRKKTDTRATLAEFETALEKVFQITNVLVPKVGTDVTEKLGDLVEQELAEMDKAIEEAAQRIADLIARSKEGDSGIKLEVNGKILDACTGLMEAIKVLVHSSRNLQEEIVGQGKGSHSVKEFYNRNHRWTEGLLSAAKVVGLSAKFMVDAANKVVEGHAKFEELVVSSQEIAAATAQLVVASKVKAERGSERLASLSQASRKVTQATGNVVATAKSCAQLVEETEVMDFTKLSLHQAKLLEMESQVRVLELESSLDKERLRLSSLRKRHYHMAGPSEGWEAQNKG